MKFHHSELCATFSIVARDPQTGQMGVAVQTHQMSVGGIVPWLLPGVGAVATQSMANVSFGPIALKLLREGYPAEKVIVALVAMDKDEHRRQVAVVDKEGRAAAHTGSGCIAYATHQTGEGYSVQANMMTHDTVAQAMALAYEHASGDLAQRMMSALEAAQAEGGDIRGMQSAALRVVPGDATGPEWAWVYDVRVDESDTPLDDLARLVRLRHASLVDHEGNRVLNAGQKDEALRLWGEARAEAPELEEMPFWQALELADHGDVANAASILQAAMVNDPRRDYWIDLIQRLIDCGLIENPTAAAELIAAL